MANSYRVAVIGSSGRGNYGHGIDTVWHEVPSLDVVALADDNKAAIPKMMQLTHAKTNYTDYREMLDKEKPQIVGIGPRWLDRHKEMAIACAERGIHMYMEKPFCRSLAEADEIIKACEQRHVKLALAHQTRYSPVIDVVKQAIADGKIGKLLEIRARGKEDKRGGAEDMWVLGSHLFNLIRTFGGDPAWCFGRVEQNGKPITKSDVVAGPEEIGPLCGDNVAGMFGLPDGATAYFGSRRSTGSKTSRFAIQIFGSAGAFEMTTGYHPTTNYFGDGSWSPGRSGAKWVPVTTQGIDKPETDKNAGLHGGNVAAVKDLIAAIEQDRQPLCGMYDGRGTIEMINAIFESQRVGTPVPLPLKTRENPLTLL
jgi:predicted dehydrogenase